MIGGFIGKAIGEPIAAQSDIQFLFPPLGTNTNVFYTPTILRGVVGLSPSILSNTSSIFSHVVTYKNALLAPFTTNTSTIFPPSAAAFYTLHPSFHQNSNTFFSATVLRGAVNIAPQQVVNLSEIFSPAANYNNYLFAPALTNVSTIFSPFTHSFYYLYPVAVENENTFYTPWIHSVLWPPPTTRVLNQSFVYRPTITIGKRGSEGNKVMRVFRFYNTFDNRR